MNDTCPNCGYCKHCGRGAQMVPNIQLYPHYPYYYGGWWQVPPYPANPVFTSAGVVTTGNTLNAASGGQMVSFTVSA